ncbi:hypothetical protein AAE121_005183 [Salmonella enterica]
MDKAVHERLIAMTEDFSQIWSGTEISHRERKRLLALIVEDPATSQIFVSDGRDFTV